MKPLLIAFLFIIVSLTAKSQDSTTTISAFEAFITRPGSVIKTEITLAGQYGTGKVLRCTAKDIATNRQTYAFRIDNSYVSEFPADLTDRKALYIDSADLDAFITTAESFLKTAEAARLSTNTRFSYITPADVQLSCYFITLPGGWGFIIDKVFQKLRTQVPDTALTLSKKRMQQLVDILKQAR